MLTLYLKEDPISARLSLPSLPPLSSPNRSPSCLPLRTKSAFIRCRGTSLPCRQFSTARILQRSNRNNARPCRILPKGKASLRHYQRGRSWKGTPLLYNRTRIEKGYHSAASSTAKRDIESGKSPYRRTSASPGTRSNPRWLSHRSSLQRGQSDRECRLNSRLQHSHVRTPPPSPYPQRKLKHY